ncbi:cardiolipin synthase [Marinicrinis lubricantis]|uniref:Cardiolipin synthase n=1 Tax=Marinicrinis lubricantis TaxID=2086470 RepID=A0ABW1IM46_9BACL
MWDQMNFWQTLLTWLPVINFFVGLAIIFLERRSPAVTWAWLMVLILIPVLGLFLYIFLGQNLARQKVYKVKRTTLQTIRKLVSEQEEQIRSECFQYNNPILQKQSSLISLNLHYSSSLLSSDNRLTLLKEGEAKYQALLEKIHRAQHHIHLQYYIYRNDEIGRKIRDALVEKAMEGVQVRLLYDAIGSAGLPRHFFRELKKAGGEVFSFFPSRIPYVNIRLNYRNHRKIVVIDGHIGFLGGFNVGDEYLGKDPFFGYWRDTHLMIEGSAVLSLQMQFALDWSVGARRWINTDEMYFPRSLGTGNTPVQIVSSGPNSEQQQIKSGFLKLIYSAKRCIYIQTPYLIPDESVLNALKIAAMSGIEVHIMIPRKGDNRFVHWASKAYLGDLLKYGVKGYFYNKGFLHSKMLMIDEETATVGTTNLDNRSFALNFETNAFIYDTNIAHQLRDMFAADLQDSSIVSYEEYERRSWTSKVAESAARLLSPIL